MTNNPRGRRLTDNHYRGSDFQRLLWNVFIYQRRYSKDELAIYLNKAPDTVLAYCQGELRLHVDLVREIIRFVAEKNPEDTELLDFFLRPAGRISVREAEARVSLNGTRKDLLLRHSILTGRLQDEVERSYADNHLEKAELRRIRKILDQQNELLAEIGEKAKGDLA